MSCLPKIFHFSKGKKKEGRGDRQAAADTSSATAPGNTGDQSAQTEIISSQKEKTGLFELSTAEAPKTIDVVAVHGLQGDAFKTWQDGNGTLWLRDLLAERIPSARIMTFGYDSTVAFSQSVARIEDKALDLLNRLGALRDENTDRPVLFICHSLGGIVVKKALILAHDRDSDLVFRNILINTKAIAFLGVPHRGSDSAWWANFAANALKGASIGLTTNTALVADLRKDSRALSTISKQFIDRGKDLKIYTFYETKMLKGVLVVDEQSARLGLPNEKLFPVQAHHGTICKMSSREDQVYTVVGVYIERLIGEIIGEIVPVENDLLTVGKSLVDLLRAKSTLCLNTIKQLAPIRVFESPEYEKWTSGETKEILWYRGVPGCGKSTMVSHVLNGLFETLAYTEVTAFFDFGIAMKMDRISANIPAAVISFIAAQLLERNPKLLSAMSEDEQKILTEALRFTHRLFSYECSGESESRRAMPGLISALRMVQESTLWTCLCQIIDRGLETMSRIYLIFDEDDAALAEDRFRFLRSIRKLWERSESTQRSCLKILIASRDYPKAREILDGLPYLDNQKEEQDCLNSLRLGAANARMALIEDGEKNTGEWILSDSQYHGWINEPGSALLWLQGNPGTGKSTLMKQIHNRLSNEHGPPRAVVAAFYYSAREGEAERSHTNMLQALLYQILLQETYETYPFFRSVFRVKRKQMQPWRLEEMKSIFVSLSRSHSGSLRFYLLLDALDESDKDGISDVISLLKEVTTSEAKLKVLVASRPGPIISSRLAGSGYYLILEDKNKKDIQKMIASSIGFLQSSDRTTFEWISSHILSRARGVFLWVSLIVSDIKRLAVDDGWSEAELKAKVQALPVSLVSYYKRITSILALQDPTTVDEGIRMLRWVVFSERPLIIDEFRDAVATSHLNTLPRSVTSTSSLHDHRLKRREHVSKRLMKNCGELVEVKHPIERAVESSDVDPGDVVQLFHETVREFLKDPTRAAAPFDMKEILGHAEIAIVCARYIRMALILDRRYNEESCSSSPTNNPSSWKYETHLRFARHLSDRPLLPYALKYLPRHMNFLEDRGQAKTSCLECFNDFDSDHELRLLSSWLQTSFHPPPSKATIDADEAAQFRVSSLVAAADQGLATAVKCLIELQPTLDAVEETTNHSALQIASKCGHLDVVKILIESEASINFHGGYFGTALQAAAYSGCDSIVKILLASGAEVNSESGYLLSPFFSACCMGHHRTAEELYRAGADPNPPKGLFRNIRDSDELSNSVKNYENCIEHLERVRDLHALHALPSLFDEAAVQFIHMEQTSNAEEMYRRALEERQGRLGPKHPTTLASLCNLASVFRVQRKYEAAEEMYRRALEIYENVFGIQHPETLSVFSDLALILQDQGSYEAAEQMYRRTLESFEMARGPEHPDTLTVVSNLALILRDQNKYEAAEEMYRRALEGYEKAMGPEHPDTLSVVSNLASILQDQRKYKAAEALNRRALEGREAARIRASRDTDQRQ